MPNPRFFAGSLVAAVTMAAAQTASAQAFPSKPIRIFCGSAGSSGDMLARTIATGITVPLGQPVIVENRPAILGAETVSKAAPDGHTLLIQGGSVWTRPMLLKTSWEPGDFAGVSRLVNEPNILAVHPSLPVNSIKELLALAKAKPGQLNYGSGVSGSSNHLAMELLKSMTGLDIVHIPYRSGPAIQALMTGQVQMVITDALLVLPQAKAGKLKALALAGAEPSVVAPGLPTIAASGVPGFDMVSTTGLFAPGKTPEVIINRLGDEVRRVMTRPEVRERFLAAGTEVVASTPAEFQATMKSEIARMAKVIKDANIVAE